MTVLTIRAHKRYAVRQPVTLRRLGGGAPCGGLMIELSSEGFRISNLRREPLTIGEPVVVEFNERAFHGKIRWAHDGIAGVRLDRALFTSELHDLVARGRGETPPEVRRYGT
ncbi:MAG TPA: PilZ domain-containing protein [Croceibacterium sp.]|nr:PilZ domain-containing protein [Croceibacterium sp.]